MTAAFILSMQVLAGCSLKQPEAVLTTQTEPSGKPLNESSTFAVDIPHIICSLSTAGLRADAEVNASWEYHDGSSWRRLKNESLTVASSAYLLFALESPSEGWPTGEYAVKLLTGNNSIRKTFSFITDTSVNLPVINSFTATPGTVTSGQQFTLSWNVSGASRITITPDIGSVESGGSRLLTAAADNTYVLTALNSGGPSSMSINLKVVAPVLDNATLEIVDIFREAAMVYYKVRNTGNAASKPCHAALFQGPTRLATDYIPVLAPGEEKTEVFGTFSWSYLTDTAITVCVDIDKQNNESVQDNCMLKLLAGVLRGL